MAVLETQWQVLGVKYPDTWPTLEEAEKYARGSVNADYPVAMIVEHRWVKDIVWNGPPPTPTTIKIIHNKRDDQVRCGGCDFKTNGSDRSAWMAIHEHMSTAHPEKGYFELEVEYE